MKKVYFLAGIVLLLSSCKKNEIQTLTKPAITENKTIIQKTQKSEQGEVAAQLGGTYFSDAYLANIEKNHSIYAAKDTDSYIFGFILHKDSLVTKTPVLEGFTDHEGGVNAHLKFNAAKARFENDLSRNSQFDYFTEPFALISTGGKYVDLVFESLKKTERYRKTDDLSTEINRILFEGKYKDQTTDRVIEFKRSGVVLGIPGKTNYSPLTDFSEVPRFDTLQLFNNSKNDDYTLYHFKIEGNKLLLYAVNNNDGDSDFSIGNVIYRLVKQ